MSSTRYTLAIAALSLGALAAVDVRQPALSTSLSASGANTATKEASTTTAQTQLEETTRQIPTGSATDAAKCPSDMAEVVGEYCQVPEQICDEFISEKRDRCVRFRPTARCIGKTTPRHFCIDRYEYPNERGKQPTVAVTWDEARDLCANEGKRLCAAEEWTVACEGPELKPYPFGFTRDATACNIDKPYIMPDNQAYDSPRTRAEEVARVSQSEPSGTRDRCVSDYGVYDMTGNVDEWVFNEHGSVQGPEYQSGLKGGYWGPVRNRCRPMTTDHNHWHHGYQIGFRCCKDATQTDVPSGGPVTEPREEWESPEALEPSRS
jgi:formylglycine-generating enzyme required for sulfatase activity